MLALAGKAAKGWQVDPIVTTRHAPRRFWRDWRSALVIVQPETVVRWHRQGFRLYWRCKSRGHMKKR
jgi:hypothetical protein